MVRTIFTRKNLILICCVAVLLLGVWLRIDRMLMVEKLYMIPDLNRDLLVGYHIAHYKEFIMLGPDSTSGLPLYNSPLFFIFTAITGVIFGFTTLGINIGNLVYQVASVWLLFLAVKNVFGARAGIVAAAMMLLFDIFIYQSWFYWQPHLMHVIYIASLYVLSLGYAKKNKWFVYLSILVFAASIATHYPPALVAPVFGVAVWMVLYHQGARIVHYLYTALFGALSIALVFSPAIFYRFVATEVPLPALVAPDFSLAQYAGIALYRTSYLISYYLPKADTALLQIFACAALVSGSMWYFHHVRSKQQKYAFLLLAAAVLSVLCGVTVIYFPYESFVAYPLRYYTAVFVPLTILIAVVVAGLWSKGTALSRIAAGSACAALLFSGGSYFGTLPEHPLAPSQHSETQFLLNNKQSVTKINSAMLEAIEKYGIKHQFDVVTFDGRDAFFVNERADDIICYLLERAM